MSDHEPLESNIGDVVDTSVNGKLDVGDIVAKRLLVGDDREMHIDVWKRNQDGKRPENHRLVGVYDPAREFYRSLLLFLAGFHRQLHQLSLGTLLRA